MTLLLPARCWNGARWARVQDARGKLKFLRTSDGRVWIRTPDQRQARASAKSYCRRLGLDFQAMLARFGPEVREAQDLVARELDWARRPLWLTPGAMSAWRRMRAAALADGVQLVAISGFRSMSYQHRIWQRKQAAGQSNQQILQVSAPPGFSEHHTGRALDLHTPGWPLLEEAFEASPAFAWLLREAAKFRFRMSYPRANHFGYVYEPWHWFWDAPAHRERPRRIL